MKRWQANTIHGVAYLKSSLYSIPIVVRTSLTEAGRELMESLDENTNEFLVQPEHVGLFIDNKTNVVMGIANFCRVILDKTTIVFRKW